MASPFLCPPPPNSCPVGRDIGSELPAPADIDEGLAFLPAALRTVKCAGI